MQRIQRNLFINITRIVNGTGTFNFILPINQVNKVRKNFESQYAENKRPIQTIRKLS